MKAILTCIAIFSFGLSVSAQKSFEGNHGRINPTFDQEIAQEKGFVKKRFPKKRKMARLYLFKNSRVKKELSFRTKRNKSKLA
jgi:hypothetical protein